MKKWHYFLLILFLISCKREKIGVKVVKSKPKLSVIQKHISIKPLENSARKEMISWKEYNSIDSLLKKFYSISANGALDKALELSNLVKLLKDSIRPKDLINPGFKIRINVLENEILRIEDMTYIPAITAAEVNFEVTKILKAFSAINSKINAIYSQIELEKELGIKGDTVDINDKN